MPIPASRNATRAKAPSTFTINERLAVWSAMISDMVSTLETGWSGSASRTVRRIAGSNAAGLPVLATTRSLGAYQMTSLSGICFEAM